jgi:hypothetical protein
MLNVNRRGTDARVLDNHVWTNTDTLSHDFVTKKGEYKNGK